MIGTEENTGIVGILVGVVMLVFAGIFLSLLVDRRVSFSHGRISTERELVEQRERIEELKRRLGQDQAIRRQAVTPLLGQQERIEEWTSRIGRQTSELKALEARREALQGEIRGIEDRYTDYRNNYRRQVRGGAAGEELGTLSTRSGKILEHAVIREVSAAGMVVRYSQGLIRLSPGDLDSKWNERFQWDAEEADAHRQQEQERMRAHLRSVERSHRRPEAAASRRPPKRKADAGEVEKLRREFIVIRDQLREAESEAGEARSQALNGRGRSVPGSLETWAQRTERLDATVRKLSAQYAIARGKLAAVSPRDRLLHEPQRR